jgi:DNA-binding CsgD family transcriptional regulator
MDKARAGGSQSVRERDSWRQAAGSSLTRREKNLLVKGRLLEPDAAGLSDRAIARELGVSQPFVSALRRQVSELLSASGADFSDEILPNERSRERASDQDVLGDEWSYRYRAERITTAQEALDRFHDEHSPLGRVRRVCWPVEPDQSTTLDWDPFA